MSTKGELTKIFLSCYRSCNWKMFLNVPLWILHRLHWLSVHDIKVKYVLSNLADLPNPKVCLPAKIASRLYISLDWPCDFRPRITSTNGSKGFVTFWSY